MAVSPLPSGRYRVQLYHAGKLRSIAAIPGLMDALELTEPTFANLRAARKAESKAYEWLEAQKGHGVTVAQWRETWLTDPLYRRPKESTMKHNEERTKGFTARYGHLPLAAVTDRIVAEWIAGGKNLSTVPVLKAMFNDACSAQAGRIVQANPFTGIKLNKGTGRAEQSPPSEETIWKLIDAARRLTCPSFAAWLQVACHTGLRPGELDALRWSAVDLEGSRLHVREQWNTKTASFTRPKNGRERLAPLTPHARDALVGLPRESDFCFVTLRGSHWTASARAYHWKAVRSTVGYSESLYLATRHYAGWYMRNVLDIPAEDVAIALGHTDGGELVRRLYGHREHALALDKIVAAYERQNNVVPLRAVKEGS